MLEHPSTLETILGMVAYGGLLYAPFSRKALFLLLSEYAHYGKTGTYWCSNVLRCVQLAIVTKY